MSPRVLDQANTSSNIGIGINYNYFVSLLQIADKSTNKLDAS